MNHSKAFWAVRNEYADQMRHLWGHGYTGDGLWGRGAIVGPWSMKSPVYSERTAWKLVPPKPNALTPA